MKIFKTSLASVLIATACGFGAKPQTDPAAQMSPVPSEASTASEVSGTAAAGVATVTSARSDGSAAGLTAAFRNFKKPPETELRQRLSDIQFHVTQADGTERPFANEYWDNKKEGIYVDVVSGEPLFSSRDKFRSGTGWPSFTRPLVADLVVEKSDRKFGMVRTEVRSRYGDSHLGHLFDDGPAPTGLRYCINSAALRFIPKERLADEGYSAFLAQFR